MLMEKYFRSRTPTIEAGKRPKNALYPCNTKKAGKSRTYPNTPNAAFQLILFIITVQVLLKLPVFSSKYISQM
jgi:hypothetical protein